MRASDWALVGAMGLAFVPALLALEGVWSSREYYSHGYLVPVVAALVAWSEREDLRALPARRDPRALAGLAAALVAYALGIGVGSVSLVGVALVGAVASGVWLLRGPAWLRRLAFPVGFLIFMVPLPDTWLTPTIVQLQLWVSRAAVGVLHAAGVPVLRDGNVIELPEGGTLFVAEACSGITSIVTLTPLAVLLARYAQRDWGRRALLVAAVVPIAMLGNLGRVVGTTLAARRVGPEVATSGLYHEAAGLAVYVVACLALVGLGLVLRRRPEAA